MGEEQIEKMPSEAPLFSNLDQQQRKAVASVGLRRHFRLGDSPKASNKALKKAPERILFRYVDQSIRPFSTLKVSRIICTN